VPCPGDPRPIDGEEKKKRPIEEMLFRGNVVSSRLAAAAHPFTLLLHRDLMAGPLGLLYAIRRCAFLATEIFFAVGARRAASFIAHPNR